MTKKKGIPKKLSIKKDYEGKLVPYPGALYLVEDKVNEIIKFLGEKPNAKKKGKGKRKN